MSQHAQYDRLAVVGAGIVGLCTAYYLREAGLDVIVLERDRVGSGASRGNGGEVLPGASTPLPAPGVVAPALRTLYRSDSALYVRLRPNLALARFLLGFAWNARARPFAAGVKALGELAQDSVQQYRDMAAAGVSCSVNDQAIIYVYASTADAREALEERKRWLSAFMKTPETILDQEALQEIEPLLMGGAAGYVLEDQATVDPSEFVDSMAAHLRSRGVEIREGARVTSLNPRPAGVTIETTRGQVQADAAVLCAGVWSLELVSTIGRRVAIFPGKGYSFRVPIEQPPQHPISLEVAHAGLVPFRGGTRVAGTMEIDSDPDRFNRRRIEGIIAAAKPYVRGAEWDKRTEEWVGPRPMTPNGLPIIGALDKDHRVFVAAGHNMLGVTLAPGTGRALAELISGGGAEIALSPFSPDRARASVM